MLASHSRSIIARTVVRKSTPVKALLNSQQSRSYHENIVEHYENPRNVGSLDKGDKNVGTVRKSVFTLLILDNSFWVVRKAFDDKSLRACSYHIGGVLCRE